METNLTADHSTGEPVDTAGLALESLDESVDRSTTTTIEVILPTILAAHVTNILIRRGVALDAFIRDLLTRFVPYSVD